MYRNDFFGELHPRLQRRILLLGTRIRNSLIIVGGYQFLSPTPTPGILAKATHGLLFGWHQMNSLLPSWLTQMKILGFWRTFLPVATTAWITIREIGSSLHCSWKLTTKLFTQSTELASSTMLLLLLGPECCLTPLPSICSNISQTKNIIMSLGQAR